MHTVAHFMCEWIFAPFCFPFPSTSQQHPPFPCMLHLSLARAWAALPLSANSCLSHCPPVCPTVPPAAPSVFVRCRQANVLRPRCLCPTSSPPCTHTHTYSVLVCVLEVLCTYPSEPSGSIINVNFYAIIALSLALPFRLHLCTERNAGVS